jgi:hypothetical protein
MISHQVQPVIPAKAGIQWSAALDTGFRRCDERKLAICAEIDGQLKIVANQVTFCLSPVRRDGCHGLRPAARVSPMEYPLSPMAQTGGGGNHGYRRAVREVQPDPSGNAGRPGFSWHAD